jgi:regulator of PEP synthase PpsR (kinase-PPPase family)
MLKQQEKENEKEDEKENEKEKEKEKEQETRNFRPILLHSSLAYSLMMKCEGLNESTLSIIVPILLSSITSSSQSSSFGKRHSRTRNFLGLLGICEDYGFSAFFIFNSSFILSQILQIIKGQ